MMKPQRPKTPSRNTVPKQRNFAVKDPVEVYCRIRPVDSPDDVVCLKPIGNNTVQLIPPDYLLPTRTPCKEINALQYTFRIVFEDTSLQKDVFERTTLPLIEDLIKGKNAVVFTYGVTSSGKTYTMTGTPTNCGILPRSLDVIFKAISGFQANKFIFKPDKQNGFDVQSTCEAQMEAQRESQNTAVKTPKQKRRKNLLEWATRETDETEISVSVEEDSVYAVFISYVEIYNNHIFDLLEDIPIDQIKEKTQSKNIRTDSKNNTFVHGATEVEVKSADDAFEVFWRGQLRRRVAHTALNTESSRSHSIFNIRLVQAPLDGQGAQVLNDKNLFVISQLSLVDLAGSERTLRTRNTGSRLKEAGNINNSLMVLRQCIEILREKQLNPNANTNKMVPYRENKLTWLFKSFFEGEGRVRMIVCANPRIEEYDETFQVMKFAEMTQEVMVTRPQESIPITGLLKGRREFYEREKLLSEQERQPLSTSFYPTLGAPLPIFSPVVFDSSYDSFLVNMEQSLLMRQIKKQELIKEIEEKQSEFRSQLIDVQSENNLVKQQQRTVQMDLDARETQLRAMERKLSHTEQQNDELKRRLSYFEKKKQNLQRELSEKDYLLNRGEAERAKIENEMQDQLEMERERMRTIMERRLATKQAELEAKMCITGEKFRMLRDIINTGDDWLQPGEYATMGSGSGSGHSSERRKNPPRTPYSKTLSSSDKQLDRITGETGQSIPAANPKHRRSISTGNERWIEHVPEGFVPTGTVLQPRIKKKKSVSKLNVEDVMNNADKYVLTHQEQDSAGDMETQLYKGDVIPSAGGGAQVIFNDIETLNQTSPPKYNFRKRSAETGHVERNEVENRCKVAMEGKPPILTKKPKL